MLLEVRDALEALRGLGRDATIRAFHRDEGPRVAPVTVAEGARTARGELS